MPTWGLLDCGEDPVEDGVEPSTVPEPGIDADALTEGDRVAYYVEGPHSAVYGYIAEGVVEKVPPGTGACQAREN